jgi:pyruvyltransferase
MKGGGARRPISVYWYGGGRNEINFGDSISPLLVEAVLGRKVKYAPVSRADMIGIGSLLDLAIQRHWQRKYFLRFHPLAVWGSGSIEPTYLHRPHNFAIGSVRGPHTRHAMGLSAECPLGDPGLLCSAIWPASKTKTHRWGIVPHIADRTSSHVMQLVNDTKHAVMIDLGSSDLAATARLIASCEHIVSSSLHGIIVADCYGIPAHWASFGDRIKGGDWKYNDYFASVGLHRKKLEAPKNLGQLEAENTVLDAGFVSTVQTDIKKSLVSIEL